VRVRVRVRVRDRVRVGVRVSQALACLQLIPRRLPLRPVPDAPGRQSSAAAQLG
jgi:hypothetical protein